MMDGSTTMDPGVNREAQKVSVEAISEVKVLDVQLPGRVRPLERTAGQRGHQERHEPVPRVALRRRAELEVEREQPDQHPQRRSEGDHEAARLGLRDRRPGRQARRQQQAVLLLQPGVQPAHARRRRHHVPHADAARAAGRFFADARQQRQPLQPDQGSAVDRRRARRANQRACFADGGVLGKIPANRLYQTGPEHPELVAEAQPAEHARASALQLHAHVRGHQPATATSRSSGWTTRCTQNLRGSFKFAEYQQPNDVDSRHASRLQRHEGRQLRHLDRPSLRRQLDGEPDDVRRGVVRPRTTTIRKAARSRAARRTSARARWPSNATDNRFNVGMGDIPLLFPDAGVMDPRYKSFTILNSVKPPFWDGTRAHAGARRSPGAPASPTRRPTSTRPGNFILDTVAQHFNVSVTKVSGAHTMKAGYCFLESVQRRGNANIQGDLHLRERRQQPARHHASGSRTPRSACSRLSPRRRAGPKASTRRSTTSATSRTTGS